MSGFTSEERTNAQGVLAKLGVHAHYDAENRAALVLLNYLGQAIAYALMGNPGDVQLRDLAAVYDAWTKLPAIAEAPAQFDDPTDAQLDQVLDRLREAV